MSYLNTVAEVLATHYEEVRAGGIVATPPSRLSRGQGVIKAFYIMKIDLVGSTFMLHGRHKETYLKLIHTYLSTIDRIARDYGADQQQMEYAGDGLLAYFAEDETTPERVIAAACYSMEAVRLLRTLDNTLGDMVPKCRLVIHHAPLVVAKIGPRAGSILTAIGQPLHFVSKIEKEIPPNTGRVTVAMREKLSEAWRLYLSVAREKPTVPQLSSSTADVVANGIYGLGSLFQQDSAATLGLALTQRHLAPRPIDQVSAIQAAILAAPVAEPLGTVIGYDIRVGSLLDAIENRRILIR